MHAVAVTNQCCFYKDENKLAHRILKKLQAKSKQLENYSDKIETTHSQAADKALSQSLSCQPSQ